MTAGRFRYFAYGSNMDTRQMAERCPTARVEQVATLEGHSPLVNVRGVMTLRSSAGRTHGVLWHLEAADVEILDHLEGVDEGRYERTERSVLLDGGRATDALVYIDRRLQVGAPRPGYLERVLHGAREHGLPRDYVDQLHAMQRTEPTR